MSVSPANSQRLKNTERGGFGFHSKTSCFLLSARLRSLSATSCRLLLALLSLNDETRRSPHSLLETMRVCPANSQRLKNMEVFKSYVSNPSNEEKRREGDSNPRCLLGTHAFQACTLNHSDISPKNEVLMLFPVAWMPRKTNATVCQQTVC